MKMVSPGELPVVHVSGFCFMLFDCSLFTSLGYFRLFCSLREEGGGGGGAVLGYFICFFHDTFRMLAGF